MENTTQIIIAVLSSCLGSVGLFSFIQFLINRNDNRQDKDVSITQKLTQMELDTKRTQLLLLMTDYPEQTTEIMKVARCYFQELGGDWYMDSLFMGWLKKYNIDKPTWLKE